MHVYPGLLIGVIGWVVLLAATSNNLVVACSGPLIISGLALLACVLGRRRPA